MKRYLILVVAMLSFAMAAKAQAIDGVTLNSYTLERNGNYLALDMALDLSQLDIKSKQVVVLTPYIVNGEKSIAMKSIGIYGRNRHFYYLRNADVKPTLEDDMYYRKAELTNNVQYNTLIPYEEWMEGSKLVFERVDYGCCGKSTGEVKDVLVEEFPIMNCTPEYIYIRPAAESVKTRKIQGSAYVNFPVNVVEILPAYLSNTAELAKITDAIDSVKKDEDIVITSIEIKGFASPEGPYKNNEILAQGRTEQLKNYVEGLYHFGNGFIKTSYETEDWAGLASYVAASNLEHKNEILAVIDSENDADVKEWIIKNRWAEDYAVLLEKCYPTLRHSDFVIDYTIRSYGDPKEIEKVAESAPQKLSLEEFYVLAQTYEPGSDKLNALFESAAKVYPNDEVANLNAANAAMQKGDYAKALNYLSKAGNRPEAIYARGVLEVLREDFSAATIYLEEAKRMGVAQAEPIIEAIANYWKVSMTK